MSDKNKAMVATAFLLIGLIAGAVGYAWLRGAGVVP